MYFINFTISCDVLLHTKFVSKLQDIMYFNQVQYLINYPFKHQQQNRLSQVFFKTTQKVSF